MVKAIKFFKSNFYNSNWIYVLLLIVVFILTMVRQNNITNFDCEICSDKAGYYMYLPALFHMGFKAENYPDGFAQQHGGGKGFRINREENKVITKFTSGIAILQLPFYTMGFVIEKLFSLQVEPYSDYYMIFINIGAAFYLVLGLFFLRKWLNFYVSDRSSFWTILVIFFGTNLYYYTLDESLMSHMYSFTLFSMLLYGLKAFANTGQYKYFILFIIPMSFAILIRPTNILFAIIALLIDVRNFKELRKKLMPLLSPVYIIPSIIFFLLIITPQLFYWKYAYGSYVVWSYSGEGFSNWDYPKFLIVWFSPQGGLFPYTPIMLLSLLFLGFSFSKIKNSWLIVLTFFVVSYMCASWIRPEFGICNFGKRPMVEYLPILMFPIAYIFEYYKTYHKVLKYTLLSSIAFFVIYNQLLFGAFNTCFFGHTWEWSKFGSILGKAFFIT